MMRVRPAARVAVVAPDDRFLAFRFCSGADGARLEYWSLPGGAVEEGESFGEAAARELFEETGIRVGVLGTAIGSVRYELTLSSGETVLSDERLYAVRLDRRPCLARDGLTETERLALVEARWWSLEELRGCVQTFHPPGLAGMLAGIGLDGGAESGRKTEGLRNFS